MKRYFKLTDDMTTWTRWHVGQILAGDGSEPRLWAGIPCGRDDLVGEVTHPGRVLEYSRTSFNAPIATSHLAEAIARVAGPDVQCIPVKIAGQTGYKVLNALRLIDCIDEERSEFMKWTEQDHRADLAGEYRSVWKMHLDTSRIPQDAHFFRLKGWEVALIVSEQVKAAMEQVGCFGAQFQDVT